MWWEPISVSCNRLIECLFKVPNCLLKAFEVTICDLMFLHSVISFRMALICCSTALISASISSRGRRRGVPIEIAIEIDLIAHLDHLCVLVVDDDPVDDVTQIFRDGPQVRPLWPQEPQIQSCWLALLV